MSIDRVLADTFGFSEFRPHQREVIEHLRSPAGASGALVVMPTGGGKSLLYQIPALMEQRLSIVVSPLISLMKDQVDALCARGVRAACVNSSMSRADLLATREAVIAGQIQLLYVAPERFNNAAFMEVVQAQSIYLLAIDEAHCISHWGSGFRPSYRYIAGAIERLQPERVIALTATANRQTQLDIIDNLGIPQAHRVVTGFARDDLSFGRCRIGTDAYGDTRDAVLDLYDPEEGVDCGIVYMVTKKNCEQLATDLRRWGVPAQVYHAGLSDGDKQSVQERWMQDNGVIVATTAFGMGIDKPNVRFVINGGLPSNIEEWYQMVGRGSRDGQGCTCHLFSDGEDLRIKHFLIETQYPGVADLRKFKLWIDGLTAKGPVTRDMTQAEMATAAKVRKHTASGCCGFLARLGLIEKLAPGTWTFHPSAAVDLDYSDHQQRITDKQSDIERVRRIASGAPDKILAEMCSYLAAQ
ncbi:MAG: RecQ family ATP-dependent DNA helicase [Planctomycetota bacterium]|nr:RecQ family ATP-dependent DNA helicase [Planctomycetota bacterium]